MSRRPWPAAESTASLLLQDDGALAPDSPDPLNNRVSTDTHGLAATSSERHIQVPQFRIRNAQLGGCKPGFLASRMGINIQVHLPGITDAAQVHVFLRDRRLIVLAGAFHLYLELGVRHGSDLDATLFQPRKCRLDIFLEVPMKPEAASSSSLLHEWSQHPADTDLEAAREASMIQAMMERSASGFSSHRQLSETSSTVQADNAKPSSPGPSFSHQQVMPDEYPPGLMQPANCGFHLNSIAADCQSPESTSTREHLRPSCRPPNGTVAADCMASGAASPESFSSLADTNGHAAQQILPATGSGQKHLRDLHLDHQAASDIDAESIGSVGSPRSVLANFDGHNSLTPEADNHMNSISTADNHNVKSADVTRSVASAETDLTAPEPKLPNGDAGQTHLASSPEADSQDFDQPPRKHRSIAQRSPTIVRAAA